MKPHVDMRNQFQYEWQISPKTWLSKFFVGLIVIFILWLAIMFFTSFLIMAGVLIALLILYAILPFPKKRCVIKRVDQTETQKTVEIRQDH